MKNQNLFLSSFVILVDNDITLIYIKNLINLIKINWNNVEKKETNKTIRERMCSQQIISRVFRIDYSFYFVSK